MSFIINGIGKLIFMHVVTLVCNYISKLKFVNMKTGSILAYKVRNIFLYFFIF